MCPYGTRTSSSSTRRWKSGRGVRSTRQVEVLPLALEVLVELAPHPVDRGCGAEDAGPESPCERLELVLRLGVERDAAEPAVARGHEQRSDRGLRDVVGDVEQASDAAASRKRRSSSSGTPVISCASFASGARRTRRPRGRPLRSIRARRRCRRRKGRSRSGGRPPHAPWAAARRPGARARRRRAVRR